MKDALAEVSAALAVSVPDLGSGKTLEAVVLLTCARQVQNVCDVEIRGHDCRPTSKFVMRGAPGHLADPQTGAGPSHVLLRQEPPATSWELHNGLEFVGASDVEHEIDVSMVAHVDAQRVRSGGGGAMQRPPGVGIELKEYGPGKTVDKNAVRAFVACCVDLMPLRHLTGLSVGMRRAGKEMRLRHPPATMLFLTTAGASGPSKDLASFYGIDLHSDVMPDTVTRDLAKILWHVVFDGH